MDWKAKVDLFEQLRREHEFGVGTGGASSMSTSPLRSALNATEVSGMITHSTRSTFATLPPANPLAGSERGT